MKQFAFAMQGIQHLFTYERNGRIQLVLASLVIITGLILHVSPIEWCILLLCIALVLACEMINTAIEKLCALVSTDYHPLIKVIKDVAAGAVLWTALFAAIIGLLIFVPHLF